MIKLIALLLLSGSAMAQTYQVSLSLDGTTYFGDFTYTPTYTTNSGGQTVTIGDYTNVSLSDPYAGLLTSINDPYDGNNVGQHELWFLNSANMPIGINIPNAGVVGRWVPVTGAIVFTTPTSYESCTVCDASITEVATNGLLKAPELDPAGGLTSTALLGAMILILRSGRRG